MNIGTQKKVIAICGKGGVGKTAFTSMMVRVLMESENTGNLLVIDADPALGLPNTLGISAQRTMGQIRESIIDTARHGRLDAKEDIINQLDYMVFEALVETNDFAFLAMGRTDAKGCFCPVNILLRNAISSLSKRFDTILIDGEAGLEQINRQVINNLDILIILADTSFRGRETVAHIKKLVVDEHVIDCKKIGVIFNRVQSKKNKELLFNFADSLGIEVFGAIPHDENIVSYDFIGRPLLDLPADSPALVALKLIKIPFQEQNQGKFTVV
jgi:CO dehydrogenase maturation factor